MPDPILIVENLTFRYRDRTDPAIQDMALEIHPGELVLVAGASGCGKTTLARCINGLIPRSYKGELKGRILINGQDTASLSLARISEMVGTVLQDPERQILGSRVLNEVAFGLENLGLPREEIVRRVDEGIQHLRIAHLRDRETFHLSGGEKQKVALAGVLAMRPRLLILDEPLASLDPASAQEALALVRRLVDEGMAVMMVEHRVEDVLRIAPDCVVLMKEGRVQYAGAVPGMVRQADYREVKLPAPLVLERAAADPAPPALPNKRNGPQDGGLPLVRFEDVSFHYEGAEDVLRGVRLNIGRGDVVAVLGPNGAGKTTLVKQAIGLLKPSAGRVIVDGRDTREMSVAQIAGTLGYVFQSPSHMLFAPTVGEELSFGPANLGHPPARVKEEVKDALTIMDLLPLEKDPPLALSFGQQKRVSIAAILAMRSRILVMDEPTAGQDYRHYMTFMDSILQLQDFEAILFITHDVDLAVVYSNRVLLMSEGTIVADGPPQEVLADFDRLRACRLVPTSLLATNLEMLGRTGRFLRAEALAHVQAA
jgi:energy-coupling factor transport system ATP-binding protein